MIEEKTLLLDGLDFVFSVRSESILWRQLLERLTSFGLSAGVAHNRPHIRISHAGTTVLGPPQDTQQVRVFSRSSALLDEQRDRRVYWAASAATPPYELRVNREGIDHEICCGAADFDSLIMYLFREALHSYLNARGSLALHAGAVTASDGRTWLVVGPKGAGKTTAVLDLCCRQGMALTANDRCYVLPDGKVVGMPLTLRLTQHTLERYPALAGGAQKKQGDEKWLINPGLLSSEYRTRFAPVGRLAGILLPGRREVIPEAILDNVVTGDNDPLFAHERFDLDGEDRDLNFSSLALLELPARWLPWE